MKIEKDTVIEESVQNVWHVLGREFGNAHKWASFLKHSKEMDSLSLNGSQCLRRGCEVSGMGKVIEELSNFSDKDHSLTYKVIEGLPFVVKTATNTWSLEALSESRTKLRMIMKFSFKGLWGILMKPMMKSRMDKMAEVTVSDLKYYVEHKFPSDAKLRSLTKM